MIWICWYMSWNCYHKFVFQYKMLKQVLWNFRRDKRILRNILTCCFWPVSVPDCGWQASSVDRMGRPHHGPVDPWGRPTCTEPCTSGRHSGAVDRTREPCSLDLGVDRHGRPEQRVCSLYLGGRPKWPNGHIYDRWRSTGTVDRKPVKLTALPNG